MRGTEKQIKWAEEIKAATLEAIDKIITDGQKYAGTPKADALLEKLAAQREALKTCEYAGDIIDCFQYIDASAPLEARCKAFVAACRVNYPNTPAQKMMLGK